MDNKKIDEIMQEYVASTNGSVDNDFAKLDLNSFQAVKAKAKAKSMHNKIWAGVAAMVVLIIALSVALPITLNGNNPSGPEIFYFDYENVVQEDLTSLQDVKTVLSQDVNLPKVESMEEKVIKLIGNNNIIGISFNMFVFDEKIDDIKAYILYDNVEISSLSDYSTLNNVYKWNDKNVLYSVLESSLFTYNYVVKFTANGFTHYYTITSGVDMEIGELLNWIF